MDTYSIVFIFHIIGIALGAGGAFTSDFLFLGSMLSRKLKKDHIYLLKIAGLGVWLGVTVLIASGFTLLWMGDFALLSSSVFQAKLTIISFIVLNGLLFHLVHLPYLKNELYNLGSPDNNKKTIFLLLSGALSSTSWLSVIVLGYLRYAPFSYLQIMGIYILLIGGAMASAFLLKKAMFSGPSIFKGSEQD